MRRLWGEWQSEHKSLEKFKKNVKKKESRVDRVKPKQPSHIGIDHPAEHR
jgi:hypothetical protein